MKLVENTQDKLVLRQAPLIFGSVLIAGMLLVFRAFWRMIQTDAWQTDHAISLGILFLALTAAIVIFVKFNQLTLDRRGGSIQILQVSPLGRKAETYALDLLEGASTQTTQMSGNIGHIVHRLVLILKDHPDRDISTHPTKDIRPVMATYQGGQGADKAAKIINLWLGNT